jgi:hypothetical protein
MREAAYQAQLIKRLKLMFPGCVVLKNDSGYLQGIPDLLILFNERWAMLEVKTSQQAKHQPNQDYYVHLLDNMSWCSYIYPAIESTVLDDLQRTLESGW